ncbi:MAG: type II toxin-antitoxin system PemK/MazF family toxin [Patescibacteria group bacterium]|jgi:mRNA interferase MazF
MLRDYKKWHSLKKTIEDAFIEKLFREREVWWCSLGANVGFEQDGKHDQFERPVLVLRKFSKGMFWGLPLTSRPKQGPFYMLFDLKNTPATILMSQLRVLSSKRLIRRIGKISSKTFLTIQMGIVSLLEIKTDPLYGDPRVPNGN